MKNSEQSAVKSVRFQQDQVEQSIMISHKDHSTLMSFTEILDIKKENAYLKKENAELITENAELITENAELRKEVDELNSRVSKLSADVALYRGNREECVPKSSYDELRKVFEETMKKKQEYLRRVKEIDDVHRSDTDSLKTEINILKEELKKSEKKVSYLSSNVISLSQTNEELKQVIDSFNSSQNLNEEPKKEENSELIPSDWHNIKTSLRYLLNDQKLRKQFVRDAKIDAASMKLTIEIIEKLGL